MLYGESHDSSCWEVLICVSQDNINVSVIMKFSVPACAYMVDLKTLALFMFTDI